VNVDVTLIVSVDSCAKGITVFKTACDLRARLAGFDSQAVPPIFRYTYRFYLFF
jgi:hypothetical protein